MTFTVTTWSIIDVISLQLQRSKLANGTPDIEAGSGATLPQAKWYSFISPIFIQAFTLTFLAEWGDRSQLTTIILAAREVRYISAVAAVTCVYACFVKIFEICLPHDNKCMKYTSVEPDVLIDSCSCMSSLGGLDSSVCLFESRRQAFTTPMRRLFTYVNLVFSRFPGSLWGRCRWNAGTLSVYRTGRDRREDGGPENLCQNRWAFKRSYMEHAPPPHLPNKNVSLSPLFSYNHRRDRFPGLCSLRPFLQTGRWNQLKRGRDSVFLCKYVET